MRHTTTITAAALAFAAFAQPAAACGREGQTYAEQRACEKRNSDAEKDRAREASRETGALQLRLNAQEQARQRAAVVANQAQDRALFFWRMREHGTEDEIAAAWANAYAYALSRYSD